MASAECLRDNIFTHGVSAHRSVASSLSGAPVFVLSGDCGRYAQWVEIAQSHMAGLVGGQQPDK
jgi:hypothetical protein